MLQVLKRIKLLFILLILSTMWANGQLMNLRNGFVAATSDGVYYLQDGYDEWLKLNANDLPNSTQQHCSGVSYNGSNLFARYEYWGANKVTMNTTFGNNISTVFDFVDVPVGGVYVAETTKNICSKFKFPNTLAYVYIQDDNGDIANSQLFVNLNGVKYDAGFIPEMFTSMASDGDSILVVVGTNNTLTKIVVSNIPGNRSIETISGLASATNSRHQICYDSARKIFWIVSDEGNIYSYDKTTVEYIETIPDCAESFSIVADVVQSSLFVSYISTNGQDGYIFMFGQGNVENIFSDPLNTYQSLLAFNNRNTVLYNYLNYFFLLDDVSYTSTEIAALPDGVIVYDLYYIDYLP